MKTSLYLRIKFIYFFLQVEIPKGRYKGQKLIKLVNKKTPPSTNKTIPNVPEITLVKNNMEITAAMIALSTRSKFPIFAFIT